LIATPPGWSPDANWFWDGFKWNDAVSPDGKWRFDCRQWQQFHGQRSLMPAQPLYQAAAGPAPSPPGPPAVQLPSWVAQSEVDRLAQERQEREQLAAQAALPQVPLPPELDWRRVGEHMEYSRRVRVYSDWQVGPASVAIFILLYLLCPIGSLIFLWRSGWRFNTKIIVALVTVFGPFLIVFLVLLLGGLKPQT
jgi:hypothetical protein